MSEFLWALDFTIEHPLFERADVVSKVFVDVFREACSEGERYSFSWDQSKDGLHPSLFQQSYYTHRLY